MEKEEIFQEEDDFLDNEDVKEKTFTDTEETEVLEESAAENGEDAAVRDFADEIRELWAIRPDLKGKTLPPEVARAAAEGQRLALAYFAYDAETARTRAENSRRENEILRQNAASAARAPVRGSTGEGGNAKPRDPFLEGFETQW